MKFKKNVNKQIRGFTIVELLIVVVVIAILATITIIAFNGIQNRAYDSAIQNDLTEFSKRMEFFKTTSGLDRYPNTLAEFTTNLDVHFSKSSYKTTGSNNAAIYCRTTTGANYIFIALSKSGTTWSITPGNSPQTYSGTDITSNGFGSQTTVCPAAISGGVSTDNAWAYSGGSWTAWTN